jgi:hypothetical protein
MTDQERQQVLTHWRWAHGYSYGELTTVPMSRTAVAATIRERTGINVRSKDIRVIGDPCFPSAGDPHVIQEHLEP